MEACKNLTRLFDDIERYGLSSREFREEIFELARQCADFGDGAYSGGDLAALLIFVVVLAVIITVGVCSLVW